MQTFDSMVSFELKIHLSNFNNDCPVRDDNGMCTNKEVDIRFFHVRENSKFLILCQVVLSRQPASKTTRRLPQTNSVHMRKERSQEAAGRSGA